MCIQGIMVCVILEGCVCSMELELDKKCLVLGGLYDSGMGIGRSNSISAG